MKEFLNDVVRQISVVVSTLSHAGTIISPELYTESTPLLAVT